MRIEVVRAWPRGFEARQMDLPEGSVAAEAAAASGFELAEVVAYAVFGVRVGAGEILHDGDRLELLRPLVADPKDARRRRAGGRG